jgi:acetate kinase
MTCAICFKAPHQKRVSLWITLDGLVFTAGIGENSALIRQRICDSRAWLGCELDFEANVNGAARISTPASKVSILTIPTNEELLIARHTSRLLGLEQTPEILS